MEENHRRQGTRHSDSSKLAVSDVVSSGDSRSKENNLVQKEFISSTGVFNYEKFRQYSSGSMPLLDKNLKDQGFSNSEIRFMRKAWRPSTKKTYSNYLKQWLQFCEYHEIDPNRPKPCQVARFLILLSKQGSAYSTVNIARCLISAVTHVDNYNMLGNNRYVCMAVATAGNVNPPEPRYDSTWKVADVLKVFKRWRRNSVLSVKLLTWKLTVLLLLCTAQRGQTIWLLPLSGLIELEEGVRFRMKHQLKPGEPLSVIKIARFPQDTRLCPVRCLKKYIERTKGRRGKIDQLLITTVKPYRPCSRSEHSIQLGKANAQ